MAAELLKRLLAGERGNLPMYLAMLLERSSPLSNTDEHYRKILPSELADARVGPETVEEIITTVCAEVSQNPDAALIAAVSTTGAEKVTKCVTEILIEPPRAMTMDEYGQALGVASAYLPDCIIHNPQFLSDKHRQRLVEQLRDLANAEHMTVRRDASALLKRLTALGAT